MALERIKQQARLSVLEKLKQKGAPGMSPIPAPMSPEEIGSEAPEETLNDMGFQMGPEQDPTSLRTKLRKKKRIGPEQPGMDAAMPTVVTGKY
jgi:hypothetical protein